MLTACTPVMHCRWRSVASPRSEPYLREHHTMTITSSALPGRARSSGPAIEAEHLVKRFGDMTAVDDVSFTVPEGTVLGMLGPNGAGKTTTVRMMTTLTVPT